jgi:hypothetical protein
MAPVKKNKTRKFPIEFDRNVLPKNIRWLHDFDYLEKLPKAEQEFMAKFIREYLNGNVKKGDKTVLLKSSTLRRDCYRRKNAQNRDLMSVLNSSGRMDRISESNQTAGQFKEAFSRLTKGQRRSGQGR